MSSPVGSKVFVELLNFMKITFHEITNNEQNPTSSGVKARKKQYKVLKAMLAEPQSTAHYLASVFP